MIQHLVLSLLDHLLVLGKLQLELGRIQGKHLDLKMELYMRLELELLDKLVQGHQPRQLALVLVLKLVVLLKLLVFSLLLVPLPFLCSILFIGTGTQWMGELIIAISG